MSILLVGCAGLPAADPPAEPTAAAVLPTPTPASPPPPAPHPPPRAPPPRATRTETATKPPTVTATASATLTETATMTPAPPTPIPWEMAGAFAGQEASVCGPVVRTYFARKTNGSPTFLDIGLPYPDPQRLNVIIWGRYRELFPEPPEHRYYQKNVCVSGHIELYQGTAQIEVRSPEQIVEQPAP